MPFIKLIEDSELFRSEWYLSQYFQAVNESAYPTASAHYLEAGWLIGCNPSPLFDNDFYLDTHSDVKNHHINPLIHYIVAGRTEGRAIRPVDERTLSSKMAPIDRLVKARAEEEMIRCSEWFNAEWYLSEYQDVLVSKVDPAHHYYYQGWREGRNPSTFFDTNAYIQTHFGDRAPSLNPLIHFLTVKPTPIAQAVQRAARKWASAATESHPIVRA